jgi:hypothetical protein
MGNRVMWWGVALIFGGVLTAGTGAPGAVFLIFMFMIGMLNEWGRGSGRRERENAMEGRRHQRESRSVRA